MEKPYKWTARALFFLLKKQLFDVRKQIKIRICNKKKDYDGHLMCHTMLIGLVNRNRIRVEDWKFDRARKNPIIALCHPRVSLHDS